MLLRRRHNKPLEAKSEVKEKPKQTKKPAAKKAGGK